MSAAESSRPPRILVVDDEDYNRDILTRLLTREGWVVTSAANGTEALAAIAANSPDIVLLDVMMPDGPNGIEVTRSVKSAEATRLIPVVLVTAVLDREHRLTGIEAGADEFLTKPIDDQELITRVRSLLRMKSYTDELDTADSVILSLGLTVESRDPYTNGHCVRLAHYGTALGRALGLDGERIEALRRGAFLHDVGKIGIPDAVLHKKGRLTAIERALMEEHPVIGERLCGALRSLKLVRPIVRHHHERRDGSGYPDGLNGDAVPLLAEIVGIVDTFDAMTTTRPYRQGRPHAAAYDELRREASEGKWQSNLVDTFIQLGRDGAFREQPATSWG